MKELFKKNIGPIITTGIVVGIFSIIAIMSFESSGMRVLKPLESIGIVSKIEEQKQETPVENKPDNILLPPDSIMIALYGSPDTPVLGSLGEQSATEALSRVKQLADQYASISTKPIIPTFEIITTIAAGEPTDNGDYSREISIDRIKPWVEIAKQNNVYVLLDLQPGHTDFTTQAKMYEELLSEPNVGLALDPEWRLKPGQRHMKQIGSVTAAEINDTAAWLTQLCKTKNLPKKVLLLHQFKLSMIENRETLNTSAPELEWIIQMDGLGAQNIKQDTWKNVQNNAPQRINFGWKNFIDEDKPMLTPDQTMQITPTPAYVSYQ